MRKSDFLAIFEAYSTGTQPQVGQKSVAAATTDASNQVFQTVIKQANSKASIPAPVSQDEDEDAELNDLLAWQDEHPELADKYRSSEVKAYEETRLVEWAYKQMVFHIGMSYASGQALLIYGDSGLGKTQNVYKLSKRIAHGNNLEFIDLDELDPQQLEQLVHTENLNRFFIFKTLKIETMNPEDFRGLPSTLGTQDKFLKYKKEAWVNIFANPTAHGTIFLDEINHANPQTLKAVFGLVDEKRIDDLTFSKNINIVAAGNLDQSHGNEPLTPGLISRFKSGVLITDPEGWLEWATGSTNETGDPGWHKHLPTKTHIDKNIIEYVKFNPKDNFYVRPIANESNPFPTPRSFERLSHELKILYRKYNAFRKGKGEPFDLLEQMHHAAAGYCGTQWAAGFIIFVRNMETFDLHELHKRGHEIVSGYLSNKSQSLDKIYHLMYFVVNKFKDFGKTINTKSGPVVLTEDILVGIMIKIANTLFNENNEFVNAFWTKFKDATKDNRNWEGGLDVYVKICNRMGQLIGIATKDKQFVCEKTGLNASDLTKFMTGPFVLLKEILAADGTL